MTGREGWRILGAANHNHKGVQMHYTVQGRYHGEYLTCRIIDHLPTALLVLRQIDVPGRVIERPTNRIVGTGDGHGHSLNWDTNELEGAAR